ncbi:MAG: AsmA-like C-terminal region-containing protein, partial [Candidatus Acidiferrales bacterium]
SQVEFSDFKISFLPRVHLTITGLVLRHRGRTDIPPLFQIQKLSLYAHPLGFVRSKPRIEFVELDGLQIHVPPRRNSDQRLIQKAGEDLEKKYPILIEELRADDATLFILRSETEKPARVFPIHHLLLRDFSFDRPAKFNATLTNAIPKGEIEIAGEFGPWVPGIHRETPAFGHYSFQNADLGALKGIEGILSSTGSFTGPLDQLEVDGVTDVSDFRLRTADHPIDLRTEFTAIVDGTNGDTYLERVNATFLHTVLMVRGKIVDESREVKGRTIVLNASSQDARVEDLIRLATKGNDSEMKGYVALKTSINIPEGDGDLIQRLKLSGQFRVIDIQFTDSRLQRKVDTLSRTGQGQPKDMEINHVSSELRGKFQVNRAVVTFSDLRFHVPGASIKLNGNYDLESEGLNFHGHLLLQAKPSEATTGVKSLFLKILNPFFEGQNGGTDLAIRITGTKDDPSFGLDD